MQYYISMRLILKTVLLSICLAFSLSSFASDYVSIFKQPKKKVKTLLEFKKDLQEDALQFRSIMSVKKKKGNVLEKQKTVELVKQKRSLINL